MNSSGLCLGNAKVNNPYMSKIEKSCPGHRLDCLVLNELLEIQFGDIVHRNLVCNAAIVKSIFWSRALRSPRPCYIQYRMRCDA
jgi:hypothetical protein